MILKTKKKNTGHNFPLLSAGCILRKLVICKISALKMETSIKTTDKYILLTEKTSRYQWNNRTPTIYSERHFA